MPGRHSRQFSRVLKYAVNRGSPMDASLTETAVESNNMDMLKCLDEGGCPQGDARTTAAAVKRDDDVMLLYAVNRGCPLKVSVEELAGAPKCSTLMTGRPQRKRQKLGS